MSVKMAVNGIQTIARTNQRHSQSLIGESIGSNTIQRPFLLAYLELIQAYDVCILFSIMIWRLKLLSKRAACLTVRLGTETKRVH